MDTTQDWIEAYKELCTIINTGVPEIKHIDLWYNQLNYEMEEYPYPESTLFIEFNTDNIQSIGNNAQDMFTRIRFIYCFDTLSDTFDGSENQAVALAFGNIIRKLHHILQNKSGDNFSSLDRISLTKVDAPQHCIAYSQTYNCIIRDYSGVLESTEVDLTATVNVSTGASPSTQDDEPLFKIEMT